MNCSFQQTIFSVEWDFLIRFLFIYCVQNNNFVVWKSTMLVIAFV